MAKLKQPTYTSVTLECLRTIAEPLTIRDVMDLTGFDVEHVSASLHHLAKYNAAAKLDDGRWMHTPPQVDQRSRVLNERTPESKPRKTRKGKKS